MLGRRLHSVLRQHSLSGVHFPVRHSSSSSISPLRQRVIYPPGRLALAAPAASTALTTQQQQQQQKQYAIRRQSTDSAPPSTPPVYQPPKTGLLSKLPSSWVPYAELIRLDKPAGTLYLFSPCVFGTLLAAPMASPIPTPLEVVWTIGLFFAGATIMRGAGCTVNDFLDRNLDPHVARTRFRPLARRAISPQTAIVYLGFQLLAGLGVLLQFPTSCLYYSLPGLILLSVYPLAKRVTSYPQFVLGLAFSWGSLVAFPAMGVDLMTNSAAQGAFAALYASCIAWTLNYDMIYAFQDIKDDPKAGIKSIAQAHHHNAKQVLYGLSATQIALLGLAGYFSGAGPIFYLLSCGGGAVALTTMVRRVRLDEPRDCWWWFRNGALITGGTLSLGMFADYLYRWWSEGESESELVEKEML